MSPVEDSVVASVLARFWPGVTLGPRLKTSQNVTYKGSLPNGSHVIVRAVSSSDAHGRVKDEIAFLRHIGADLRRFKLYCYIVI